MSKIISFDLDGTLVKTTYADKIWLDVLPEIYAKEKNLDFRKAKKYLMREYEEIGSEKVEWYDIDYWFKRFDLKTDWKQTLEKNKDQVEIYPEVNDVLKRMSRKYSLILISNAKREFIDIELRESGIDKYFSNIYSATSDYDILKKYPECYFKVCKDLNIQPSELIHTGDHKKFDYKIPKKIGINSFYLDREKREENEYIVYDLKEFEYNVRIIF